MIASKRSQCDSGQLAQEEDERTQTWEDWPPRDEEERLRRDQEERIFR
jgi:hypothetical protein